MRRNTSKGFTLMELMVVIVIVAILAAVAVPLYINYVKDAQRTEAKGAIGAVVTAEQVYFQNNGTYTADDTALKVDLSDMANRWTIDVDAASATSFSVLATKSGGGTMSVRYTYTRGQAPGATDWVETD